MQAAVLTNQGPISDRPLQIVERDEPAESSGCVKLKVRACGVCRTDLHITQGDLPVRRPALIPGHQIVGDVVAGATSSLPIGTRVGVSWIGGTDGTCAYCRNGLE